MSAQRGRGGRGGHEPRTRILARERRVLELSIEGWTQHQISEDVGVSQAAVSKILRRIERRHSRELSALHDRHRARHALRLEHVYAESMRAWTASKQDATRRRQRKTHPTGGGSEQSVAEVTVERRHGDPRYLEEGRRALADLRNLLGLDAPNKVDVRTRERFDEMTDEELRDFIEQQRHDLAAGVASPVVPALEAQGDDETPLS